MSNKQATPQEGQPLPVPTKVAVPHPPAPDGHIPMKMSKPVAEVAPPQAQTAPAPDATPAPDASFVASPLAERALPPQSQEPKQPTVNPETPAAPATK